MDTKSFRGVTSCRVDIPAQLKERLFEHLFPGDGDEHAAVLAASIVRRGDHVRLLVRHIMLAVDGVDYVAGIRGYRHLRGEFVHRCLTYCRENGFAYLAAHNHGGRNEVAFSGVDLASHERGYPALLDLTQGLPVGALVFATKAAAGDIWWTADIRIATTEVRVIGHTIERLTTSPVAGTAKADEKYVRQVLLFGDVGQAQLKDATVGVIGAGGAGSLLVEYLARLGVGRLIVADPDRIELANLSRVVGATRWDAYWPLTDQGAPRWLRTLGRRLAKYKVSIAKRVARAANPGIEFVDIPESIVSADVAQVFAGCDFLFLAADSASARLVFNAIVQQYYVPGIQVGAKIRICEETGDVQDVFSVMRWTLPGHGCLWCSGLISPHKLALEAKTDQEREEQRYGSESPNPSVIALNAVAASYAVNEFLFAMLGLRPTTDTSVWGYMWHHLSQRMSIDVTKPAPDCGECSNRNFSRFGQGDKYHLPTNR